MKYFSNFIIYPKDQKNIINLYVKKTELNIVVKIILVK